MQFKKVLVKTNKILVKINKIKKHETPFKT